MVRVDVLTLEDMTKQLGSGRERLTIGPVTLALGVGTITALVGRSGSGKSTVLACAAGLARPTSGRVLLDGQSLTRLSDQRLAKVRRESFGFVFQDYTLIDALTAEQNIGLPARMSRRVLDRTAVQALAERLGLGDRLESASDRLSGGERQRVAIARAVANGARVLFADEPSGALDPVTRDEVTRVMEASMESSIEAILLATHDVELAARAHRVVVLDAGTVVTELDHPSAADVLHALRATSAGAAAA